MTPPPTIVSIAPGARRQCAPSDERTRFTLITADRAAPQRQQIEAFIAQRFEDAYGARIGCFLPELVALLDRRRNVVAAAGFACAGDGPLFLERYLASPVEAVFHATVGCPVSRGSIVEIGNLAARAPGGARFVASALAGLLADIGFEWAVFTATVQVRNALSRCGLVGYDFGQADGRVLGDALSAWGTYYDNDPRLVGGSLCSAAAVLASRHRGQSWLKLPC